MSAQSDDGWVQYLWAGLLVVGLLGGGALLIWDSRNAEDEPTRKHKPKQQAVEDTEGDTAVAEQVEQGPDRPKRTPSPDDCAVEPTGGPTGKTWLALRGSDHAMTFLGLSSGRFCMGSPEGAGADDEHPQHAVSLGAFFLGQSEVTQAQWKAVVKAAQKAEDPDAKDLVAKRSRFKGNHLPVEHISWCDAVRFANALSRLEGLSPAYTRGTEDCDEGGAVAWDKAASGFRLPTEAEWEYAARAGSTAAFASGSDKADLAHVAWYGKNSSGQTHPVCTTQDKPWGLCDLHGNVWEWTWDRHTSSYPAGEASNPDGPDRGSHRVLRGGSWSRAAAVARAANRFWLKPSDDSGIVGFRLVLPEEPRGP